MRLSVHTAGGIGLFEAPFKASDTHIKEVIIMCVWADVIERFKHLTPDEQQWILNRIKERDNETASAASAIALPTTIVAIEIDRTGLPDHDAAGSYRNASGGFDKL